MGELKALLEWEGQPLLRYQAETLLAAPIERLVVVLGYRQDELAALLPSDPRVRVTHNPDYASGKVSSIIAGVGATAPGSHVMILGVDQPRPSATLRVVCEAHVAGEHAISIASFGGRRGHPVVFAPFLRPALLALDERTEGLRAVVRDHQDTVRSVETADPLTLANLNTPEDYAAALRISSTSSARAGNQ